MQKGRSFQDFEAFEARFDEILLVVSRHDHGEAGARLLPVCFGPVRRGAGGRAQPRFIDTITRQVSFASYAFFSHAAINSTRVLHPKSAVESEFGAYFLNRHVFGPFGLVELVLFWACRERNLQRTKFRELYLRDGSYPASIHSRSRWLKHLVARLIGALSTQEKAQATRWACAEHP